MAVWWICGAPSRAERKTDGTGRIGVAGILAVLGLLTGCGTDVRTMLVDESRLAWQAQAVLTAAAEAEPGSEELVHAAEAAKQQACAEINQATMRRWRGVDRSFTDGLLGELTQFVVLVYPVETVEQCAEAHRRYRDEVLALYRHLTDRGVALEPME